MIKLLKTSVAAIALGTMVGSATISAADDPPRQRCWDMAGHSWMQLGPCDPRLDAYSVKPPPGAHDPFGPRDRQQCEAAGKRWVSQTGTCANKIAIPLRKVGSSYKLGGVIGSGMPVDFTLDTGAELVCLPDTMVDRLIALGLLVPEDFTGSGRMRTADGATRITRRFILRSLVVGDQNVHKVEASDGCREPLLGQSFLGVFNSYHIDNQHQTLVLD